MLGPNFDPDWICIGESCNSCAHQTIVKRFANTSLKSLLDEYELMGEDFGRFGHYSTNFCLLFKDQNNRLTCLEEGKCSNCFGFERLREFF